MGDVAYFGHLEHLARGAGHDRAWQTRYFELHKASPGHEPRLEWAKTREDFYKPQHPRKSIPMNIIQSVGTSIEQEKPFTFRVYVKEREEPFVFAADCQETLELWLNHLHQLVAMVQQTQHETVHLPSRSNPKAQKTFTDSALYEPHAKESRHDARIVETAASTRCQLFAGNLYFIIITPQCIYLRDQHDQPINSLSWPYKYIRRYGRSRSTFTLEAGRKCPSGEGMFTFKVADGEKVFAEVQERTRAMKANTQSNNINPHHASPSASPPDTPSSAHSPEAQPPLPLRNYGEHPFDSDTVLPNAGQGSAISPTNVKDKKKHGHFLDKFNKKLRGSMEDLVAKTHKRSSHGSSSGFDDIDGHVCDMGTAGSYRPNQSPLSTPSPNATKRQLPEIPRAYAPPLPLPANSQLPTEEHIYEDADKVVPHSRPGPPSEHHYAVYDVAGSKRRSPEVWEDGERCDSGPGLLNQQVPLRQESVEGEYDENYTSIPDVKNNGKSDLDDYAEPQTKVHPNSKVSGILNTLHSNALPNDDTEVYAVAGNEYGCLDLLNAQNRPHSDIVAKPTPERSQEAIYGRLSTGQIRTKTERDGKDLYANTGS